MASCANRHPAKHAAAAVQTHLRHRLQDGDRFWRMPETYVRGNTIKYLRVPNEVRGGADELFDETRALQHQNILASSWHTWHDESVMPQRLQVIDKVKDEKFKRDGEPQLLYSVLLALLHVGEANPAGSFFWSGNRDHCPFVTAEKRPAGGGRGRGRGRTVGKEAGGRGGGRGGGREGGRGELFSYPAACLLLLQFLLPMSHRHRGGSVGHYASGLKVTFMLQGEGAADLPLVVTLVLTLQGASTPNMRAASGNRAAAGVIVADARAQLDYNTQEFEIGCCKRSDFLAHQASRFTTDLKQMHSAGRAYSSDVMHVQSYRLLTKSSIASSCWASSDAASPAHAGRLCASRILGELLFLRFPCDRPPP